MKGSKYEMMWASHKKRKLNGSKKMKKGTHPELLTGNYQYINAFEVMEAAKKHPPSLGRKLSARRNRHTSVPKLTDDFFKYVISLYYNSQFDDPSIFFCIVD